MFTDLRMFDMAKEYLTGADTGSDKNSILLKQAEWAIRSGSKFNPSLFNKASILYPIPKINNFSSFKEMPKPLPNSISQRVSSTKPLIS